MTKFEKQFLLHCLNEIETIISDKEELKRVVFIFSQGKTSDTRYQIQSKITDSTHWASEEKIGFSAAVFEAIAHASYKFCTNVELTKDINQATTLLLDRYLPLLTAETEPGNRLASVKKNGTKIKLQISKEPDPALVVKQADYSIENNPNTFFSAMLGLAVIATATTIALRR